VKAAGKMPIGYRPSSPSGIFTRSSPVALMTGWMFRYRALQNRYSASTCSGARCDRFSTSRSLERSSAFVRISPMNQGVKQPWKAADMWDSTPLTDQPWHPLGASHSSGESAPKNSSTASRSARRAATRWFPMIVLLYSGSSGLLILFV
jgi:hypothetical protein